MCPTKVAGVLRRHRTVSAANAPAHECIASPLTEAPLTADQVQLTATARNRGSVPSACNERSLLRSSADVSCLRGLVHRPRIGCTPKRPRTTVAPMPTTRKPATAPDVGRTFDVHLLTGPEDCSAVVVRPRTSTAADLVVDAMTQPLAGPTAAEAAVGLSSWFSADTDGMLRGFGDARGRGATTQQAAEHRRYPCRLSSCHRPSARSQQRRATASTQTLTRDRGGHRSATALLTAWRPRPLSPIADHPWPACNWRRTPPGGR